jgi:hypothetical protein
MSSTYKPKLFIGSARESIKYANAIHRALSYYAEVTPWHAGVFQAGRSTMEDLEAELRRSDFAVFVCSPDDVIRMRDHVYVVPRDNVIFELGLFWGRLGRERVFIVVPDRTHTVDADGREPQLPDGTAAERFHIPSDLHGLTLLTYELRDRTNYDAAVNTACDTIAGKIEALGAFTDPAAELGRAHASLRRKDSLLHFFVQFGKDLLAQPEQVYDTLYDAIRTAYDPSALDGCRVIGAAVWRADGTDGIGQVAGNVGRGKFYSFRVNDGKQPGEPRIVVVDAYLEGTEQVVMFRKHVANVYLICYPIGETLVVTLHLSGPYLYDSGQFDRLIEANQALMNTVHYLFGGDSE